MDRQRSLENALRRRGAGAIVALCLCAVLLRARLAAIASPDTRSRPCPNRRPPRRNRSSGGLTGSRCTSGLIPSARIDEATGAALIRDWQVLVRRFVGAPWVVTIADPPKPARQRRSRLARTRCICEPGIVRQSLGHANRSSGAGLRARLHGPRVRHRHQAAWTATGSDRRCDIGCSSGDAPVHSRSFQPDRGRSPARRGARAS